MTALLKPTPRISFIPSNSARRPVALAPQEKLSDESDCLTAFMTARVLEYVLKEKTKIPETAFTASTPTKIHFSSIPQTICVFETQAENWVGTYEIGCASAVYFATLDASAISPGESSIVFASYQPEDDSWVQGFGFLAGIQKRLKQNLNDALDYAYAYLYALRIGKHFAEMDQAIRLVEAETAPLPLILSILTITAAVKDKLQSRAALYSSVKHRVIKDRGPQVASRMLNGLD